MPSVRVMGVVNVTPDSFSDGGRWSDPASAVEQGVRLARQGASWLDVGGESTRPGARAVSEDVELERVLPVIGGLKARLAAQGEPSPAPSLSEPGRPSDSREAPTVFDEPPSCPTCALSIDTMKPGVARAAIAAGAAMWNDVNALRAPGAVEAAAELGCDVVLMHMRGEPRTMQDAPAYGDALAEAEAFLLDRAAAAMAAGVRRERIWFDPGIGFGKRLEHNLAILRGLDCIARHGFRLLLGASRKQTVRAIDPTALDPLDRLGGSLALHLYGATKGVAAVRAHDVRETVQALKVWAALDGGDRSGA